MDLKNNLKLYFIPDRGIGLGTDEITQAKEALRGGVTSIQLRSKKLETDELYKIGLILRELTFQYKALLFVNDRVDLALTINADGVHIGQNDLPLSAIKKIVPKGFIIGVSVETLEEAIQAEKSGADYLSVQSIFPTTSKENVPVAGLDLLRQVSRSITIPVIGIGGITFGTVSSVMNTGANGVAVISAISRNKDIYSKTKELRKEVDKY